MLNPHIDVSALLSLDRDMERLAAAQKRAVLRKATRAGGCVLQQEVKKRAPKRTGKLKRNITVANGKSTDTGATAGVFVRGSNKRGTNSDRTMKKDDPRNAYYWRFVENGTAKMAPQPFIRPAFDAKEEEAVNAVIDATFTEIDQVLSK